MSVGRTVAVVVRAEVVVIVVVVVMSSVERIIQSRFVFADRLLVAEISSSTIWPNITPADIIPFLMLLGDQLVLLHEKGYVCM